MSVKGDDILDGSVDRFEWFPHDPLNRLVELVCLCLQDTEGQE